MSKGPVRCAVRCGLVAGFVAGWLRVGCGFVAGSLPFRAALLFCTACCCDGGKKRRSAEAQKRRSAEAHRGWQIAERLLRYGGMLRMADHGRERSGACQKKWGRLVCVDGVGHQHSVRFAAVVRWWGEEAASVSSQKRGCCVAERGYERKQSSKRRKGLLLCGMGENVQAPASGNWLPVGPVRFSFEFKFKKKTKFLEEVSCKDLKLNFFFRSS